YFVFSSRRRHTRSKRDWSSDVCSSDLIPDYAQVASPLYELMGKKAKFEWHEKHDRAFKELREKMSSEPVVRLPDLNKPFIVKTEIGRASCREREGIEGVEGVVKK